MSAAPEPNRVRDWLCQCALPLWASAGHDPAGGFVECLASDGSPDQEAPKRIMVQARQIYVYSHAAIAGLMPGGAGIAESGFEFLMRHGAPDGVANGFAHKLGRRGNVLDATRDLYDHAFLLLAFSWFYRASGNPRARESIGQLMSVIAGMRHGSGMGYREDGKGALPRRQNSHMHLFEAFLAAHEASGRGDMLENAGEIVDLLKSHFVSAGMLREFFDDSLVPAPLPAGGIVEPGHHQEWVWLLHRYGRVTGRDMTGLMRTLRASAARHGTEAASGLLYNEIWREGRVKDAAKRLWPQTEQLKAECALGLPDAPMTVDRIFRYFLNPAPAGAWVDRLDAQNAPLIAAIPASSFYHVFQAFSTYMGG
jgi:mannose-6-phosphate isomerase